MPDEPDEPLTALGAFLTAYEAQERTTRTEAGDHVIQALRPIAATRREHAKTLLAAAGLSHQNASVTTAVLRGIAGAKSVHRKLIPVWTMPGNQATTGHLASEFHRVVTAARVSVTRATYNFSPKSNMWSALKQASEEPGVSVCIADPLSYPTDDPSSATRVRVARPRQRTGPVPGIDDGEQARQPTRVSVTQAAHRHPDHAHRRTMHRVDPSTDSHAAQ